MYERDSTAVDTLGTWLVRYDGQRGLVSRVVTPRADSANYSFDGQARLASTFTQSSGPTQTRTLSYTGASGLARLEHLVSGVSDWYPGVYDPEGAPDEPTQGTKALGPTWTERHGLGAAVDSTVDSLSYDGWERLLAWRESRKTPPDTLWRLTADSVSFDGAGDVLTVGGAETYGTKKGRLISRTDPVTGSWSYSYDAAGNQTQATVTLAGSTKTWSYGYDALNRLVAVRYTPPGGSPGLVARYGYDVLGRRIVKRVYSKPQGGTIAYTRMSYSGDAVAFETDSAGVNIKTQYTWGADVDDLLGVRDSLGTDFQVVQDQLHSVRGLVRRDGIWVMSQRFLPSGQLLSQEVSGSAALPQPTLRYGWTGREYDAETGMYFNRARYYDPTQRRFTQEDPIGYAGGSNLYAYVGGAVLEGRDPSGLACSEYSAMRRVTNQYGVVTYQSGWSYWMTIGACGSGGPVGPGGDGTYVPPEGPGDFYPVEPPACTIGCAPPPPPRGPKAEPKSVCSGMGTQYVFAMSATLAPLFFSINLGFAVGVTDRGQVFFQIQRGADIGAGSYVGFGFSSGVNRTVSHAPLSGVTDVPSNYSAIYAGWGVSTGVSYTYAPGAGYGVSNGDFGISGSPLGKVGYGAGAYVAVVGKARTTTVPLGPPILGGSCE